ncbi:ZIP family metal transporter, partial [Francisellaceae bacterium]|nr:ZIP family metal transporter [Francisellaceae bacterium]
MTSFQWFSFVFILFVSFLGGYYPLFKHNQVIDENAFPGGKAFTSGVFLALSLTVMLPSAFNIWQKVLAHHVYPVATYIAVGTFIILLALEHRLDHVKQDQEKNSIIIPIVMTLMIGVCSFLLGTALGVSDTLAAVMVFLAIIAHKGSASFALALTMVKSKMTQKQAYICFLCFAFSTPIGIILGSFIHEYFTGESSLIFKGIVTSIAPGVFLYLSTTYGLRHTPFVANCRNSRGFLIMLAGLIITVFVSV